MDKDTNFPRLTAGTCRKQPPPLQSPPPPQTIRKPRLIAVNCYRPSSPLLPTKELTATKRGVNCYQTGGQDLWNGHKKNRWPQARIRGCNHLQIPFIVPIMPLFSQRGTTHIHAYFLANLMTALSLPCVRSTVSTYSVPSSRLLSSSKLPPSSATFNRSLSRVDVSGVNSVSHSRAL